MKGIELFDLHLGEKVYAMDTFHDESTNLIAVGLRNTILVYQIEGSDEKETIETKPTLIQAVKAQNYYYYSLQGFNTFYRFR